MTPALCVYFRVFVTVFLFNAHHAVYLTRVHFIHARKGFKFLTSLSYKFYMFEGLCNDV
jgi:hypothetical protein